MEFVEVKISDGIYEVDEETINTVKKDMRNSIYFVVFQKKNSEVRRMLCTLNARLVLRLTGILENGDTGEFERNELSLKRIEADRRNGHVNVLDIGVQDFRKFNRKKLLCLKRVADANLGHSELVQLVKYYGVKTAVEAKYEAEHKEEIQQKEKKQAYSKLYGELGEEDEAPVYVSDFPQVNLDDESDEVAVGTLDKSELDKIF